VIQRARQTGFTLTEIKQLFFGFFSPGMPSSVPWQKLKKRKIVELDATLEHIRPMRDLLEQQGKCRHCAGGMPEQDVRQAMCDAALLVSGNLYVFIRADDSQNDPHGEWESPTRGITYNFRARKLILITASSEFAPACRKHVLHPLAMAAIG